MFILICFSCLCKSRSNPFLEPTSTKQWEKSFLLKETAGAFDGARTHDWQVSTNHKSDAIPTAPRHAAANHYVKLDNSTINVTIVYITF